uniref:Uncharacterized protein n=1 Tax=Anguilla anguilla TaxID=7936 RepID=A0A0E9PM26_ANGAN
MSNHLKDELLTFFEWVDAELCIQLLTHLLFLYGLTTNCVLVNKIHRTLWFSTCHNLLIGSPRLAIKAR